MNRGYRRKRYLDLVTKARNIIPNLRLTTDIIVGFPTETEMDFNDTLNFMKKIEFDLAYIFKYSPRPGTEAAKLKDDVPELEKKRRHLNGWKKHMRNAPVECLTFLSNRSLIISGPIQDSLTF